MLPSGSWSQNCNNQVMVATEEPVAQAKRKWEHAFSITEPNGNVQNLNNRPMSTLNLMYQEVETPLLNLMRKFKNCYRRIMITVLVQQQTKI